MKKLIFTLGLVSLVFAVHAQVKLTDLYVQKGENGKYGIIDESKKVIIDYKYDEIKRLQCEYSESEFFQSKLNGKYGIIDKFGNEITVAKYDEIQLKSQSADWIITKLNGKYGFVDFCRSEITKRNDALKEIFPPKYDEIFYSAGESMPSGFVKVRLGNKWGLVNDITGIEITGMKYDEANDFYLYQGKNLSVVKLNGKYGVIDNNGKLILACKYDEIEDVSYDDSDKLIITAKLSDKVLKFDSKGILIK